MARLPSVGGDNGSWGTVLNEFLSVGLNTDGTLKSGYFNALDYGASPSANSTVNSTAINEAITACSAAGGGVVLLPSGTYMVLGVLQLKDGVTLSGVGPGTVIKQPDGENNNIPIRNFDLTNGNSDIGIRDLTIDCNRVNRPSATNVCIRFEANDANACSHVALENLHIKNVPFAGAQLMNCRNVMVNNLMIENTLRDGLTFWYNCQYITVNNVHTLNVRDDCIALNSETDSHVLTKITDVTITNCVLNQAADSVLGNGIRVGGAENVVIDNVVVNFSQAWGIIIEGGYFSNAGLPSRCVSVSNVALLNCGRSASGAGGLAVATSEAFDVTLSNIVVKNPYAHGIQLACGVLTGAAVRSGAQTASSSCGILITGADVVINGAHIESMPANAINVFVGGSAIISGVTSKGNCTAATTSGHFLVTANINNVVFSGCMATKVSTFGSYGFRIGGTTTGVNIKGCVTQGFAVGAGVSDGSSGTNDITGNLSA